MPTSVSARSCRGWRGCRNPRRGCSTSSPSRRPAPTPSCSTPCAPVGSTTSSPLSAAASSWSAPSRSPSVTSWRAVPSSTPFPPPAAGSSTARWPRRSPRGGDPALVVHHAEAGGDASLLAEHALDAARRASKASAHREAWSHYRRLLSLETLLPELDRGVVLEEASHEAYATGDPAAALELGERALAEFRRSGDDLATRTLHRWLSRIHWYEGHGLQSQVQAQLAVTVLEHAPSVELAWAYSNSPSSPCCRGGPRTRSAGASARSRWRGLGADDVRVHALVNVGAEPSADLDDEAPLGRGGGRRGGRRAPRGRPSHGQPGLHVDDRRPSGACRRDHRAGDRVGTA